MGAACATERLVAHYHLIVSADRLADARRLKQEEINDYGVNRSSFLYGRADFRFYRHGARLQSGAGQFDYSHVPVSYTHLTLPTSDLE